jgi:2-polyprenyl-3-methyl-5-hydroxy-6-metoxy-1,4-benzoquinol methylase
VITSSAERRDRIAALGFDYGAQEKTAVDRCNLCGGGMFVVLAHRDRYGFAAGAAACARCGLVFLDPVMTAAAYGRFYAGTYRPLVSAYHGRLIDARTIQQEQREYASDRGDLLAPFMRSGRYRTMLDIGGSTGVVAHEFARRFGLTPTLIDPAPSETAEAQGLGIETIEGLVESTDLGGRTFDVVILCQTVDHLLDVAGTLRRVRELLNPAGLLFIDIVDFRAAYLRNWSIEEAVKIDHPYYLTEATMTAYLASAGFAVVRAEYAADHLHVSYVARPGNAAAGALPQPAGVSELFREIRYVQNAPRP